jgi:3-phosphoshikimate 1-carboxyvinyltransferase
MIKTILRHGPVEGSVAAPPSKSYTHRALITGALGSGKTVLEHPLDAEDTRLTARGLAALGARIDWETDRITITGSNGALSCGETTVLDLDNSGTSLRLLTSLALLADHPVTLTGSARMQDRPIGSLADALTALGGSIAFPKKTGFPPLVAGGHLEGGPVTVDGSVSSQFISSLLLVAPYAETEMELSIPGLPASRSYLDITVDVMKSFGAEITRHGYNQFVVSNRKRYTGRTYAIEGDYSSASYFFAMAAICGGKMTVTNLSPASVQGDRRFLEMLAGMGCTVNYSRDAVTVERTGPLNGIMADMSSSPDTVQTLCMVAAVARTPSTITGISHLKFKESDRISTTAENLRTLGGNVQVEADRIMIQPAVLHGGTIDPANDHRTAMSFAVLGLGTGGITIPDAACVTKSFPGFWDTLDGVLQ